MTGHSDKGSEEKKAPSKSQRKREMIALQDLGKELTGLNKRELAHIPLEQELQTAIEEFHRLPKNHEARRRQMQFIGRLMRNSDHEAISQGLEQLRKPGVADIRRGQLIERWLERLLADKEEAITAFLQDHPMAERQALRQLVRNCQGDRALPAQRRRLLDYIKTHID